MSNNYDRILRDGALVLVLKLLGKQLPSPPELLEHGPNRIHTTLDHETDMLAFLNKGLKDLEELLHLEFQVRKEKEIALRMLEYYVVLQRKYKMPVRQLVVFLHEKKKKRSGTRVERPLARVKFSYEVLYLQDIPFEHILELGVPEGVVLSILGDFGKTPPAEAIAMIIERILALCAETKNHLVFVQHLLTLSKLRNKLQPIVHQILRTMPGIMQTILETFPDAEFGIFEQRYIALGKAEGRAEGRAEGKAEGKAEQEVHTIVRFLRAGKITPDEIAEILEIPLERVLQIQAQM
jgi:predicted transposase YdaD